MSTALFILNFNFSFTCIYFIPTLFFFSKNIFNENIQFILQLLLLSIYVCAFLHVCGGQRTVCRKLFSPGIELRLSGLAASAYPLNHLRGSQIYFCVLSFCFYWDGFLPQSLFLWLWTVCFSSNRNWTLVPWGAEEQVNPTLSSESILDVSLPESVHLT